MTFDELLAMIKAISKDSEQYAWFMNYEQWAEQLEADHENGYQNSYIWQGQPYLLGIPVILSNLDEPIALKPMRVYYEMRDKEHEKKWKEVRVIR